MEDAKENGGRLDLITSTVPLLGYALGIPLLIIGLVLMWSASRSRRAEHREA